MVKMCEYTDFKFFDIEDHKLYELESDTDPDIYFYQNCEYYSEDEFNSSMKMEGFSVIHFNSRSLYSNFPKNKDYLQQLQQKFNVTAISDTRLSNETNLQDGLEGYEMFWQNRSNKREGGVALFVMTAFKCKVVGDMTIVIDNVMECIATEIEVERPKNILISCIYRTPRSCIDQFNERIYELHEKHNDETILACGDFNIDLLKFNDHIKTKEFVNIMFSLSLHPLIVKPSRITKDAATLIDNIFTNVTDVKTVSELLVTDVDHLPVFAVLEMNKRLKAGTNTEISNLVRIKS